MQHDEQLFNLQTKRNKPLKNRTMKYLPKQLLLITVSAFTLTACGDLSKDVENQLNELQNKTESLDSIINQEVDQVLTIDSLVNNKTDKVKKLDTLINKSSF